MQFNAANMFDKNKLLNLGLLMLALIFAVTIFKKQNLVKAGLEEQKVNELKKNSVLTELQSQSKQLSGYEKILPRKEPPEFMGIINQLANESGVKIVSIKPLAEQQVSVYTEYGFVVNLTSDNYHNVGEFVSKIESAAGFCLVDTSNMSRSSTFGADDSAEPPIAVAMHIKVISFKN